MGIGADGEQDDLAYVDTLPEVNTLNKNHVEPLSRLFNF